MVDLRTTFIITQVGAEKLAYKSLGLSKNKTIRQPETEDLVRKYIKMYDEIEIMLEKIDGED